MTTRRALDSRGRRRSGPVHAATRRRRAPLWGGLAALAFLGAAGFAVAGGSTSGAGKGHAGARSESGGHAAAGPGSTEPTHGSRPPSPDRSTSSSPRPKTSSTPEIPRTGPGTFTVAAGGSAKAGSGKVLRYRVEVEDGLDLSTADVARQVDRILADPRGWTADGHSAFQRVSSGATDFAVRVATPGTVDKICKQHGLDTLGRYNCSAEHDVMVNLERWLLATPVYAKDVTAYRALIINHEVGHFLHHGHVGCPGPGQPAPVMMQQIKGMHGCVPNVWPYDEKGRYLTGPAVP
ncbi:DUF3152 domain-containing protein [Streptomyces yaanensis]|uniref:DUF3152 domain-containing protein n=1 Tax=Streptomyces yaanensis TaxID=1142239 RepID=A0ABV7SMV9_9ACTN|nr:DUF3152 domain-containing protein [Streptomyces sp. CGMCC 4.7035]WNC01560.1 DUF3152 domain-containing protein [Streptomyces sp. CGMCC 4.7035]